MNESLLYYGLVALLMEVTFNVINLQDPGGDNL